MGASASSAHTAPCRLSQRAESRTAFAAHAGFGYGDIVEHLPPLVSPAYRVGDLVAYSAPRLGRVEGRVNRIVASERTVARDIEIDGTPMRYETVTIPRYALTVTGAPLAGEHGEELEIAQGSLTLIEPRLMYMSSTYDRQDLCDLVWLCRAFTRRDSAAWDDMRSHASAGERGTWLLASTTGLIWAAIRRTGPKTVVVRAGLHDAQDRGLRDLIWMEAKDAGLRVRMNNDALERLMQLESSASEPQ